MIDGHQANVYEAAIHVDLLAAVRRSHILCGLLALRSGAERLAATARRSLWISPPEPAPLRLGEQRWALSGRIRPLVYLTTDNCLDWPRTAATHSPART